jgi:hypothetical protein
MTDNDKSKLRRIALSSGSYAPGTPAAAPVRRMAHVEAYKLLSDMAKEIGAPGFYPLRDRGVNHIIAASKKPSDKSYR